MTYVNEQNENSTTPKVPQTEEIKRELTDDEIATVAGGTGGVAPPAHKTWPPVGTLPTGPNPPHIT